MNPNGWAVVEDGEIAVDTVSPKRRAAIVNWLYTRRKVMVMNYHSDEEIDKFWQEFKGDYQVAEVVISIHRYEQ